MKWRLSCRDASRLASQRLDTRLMPGERLALALHLAVCRQCASFARQLQALRTLARAEPLDAGDATLAPEARERIAKTLRDRT